MALTKVRGGAIDNPLTLGGGSASDNSIIFDGNAQDFHIGLDDSTDSLTIGLGSTLGTTSHMVIDANGHITKPLQSAFQAAKGSGGQQTNVSNDDTVTFPTEVFDQNGDFASNTFTAPVTGKYQLQATVRTDNTISGLNFYGIGIVTSNRSYADIFEVHTNSTYLSLKVSVLADMDASDTAKVVFNQSGGSAHADLEEDAARTHFSGYLVA